MLSTLPSVLLCSFMFTIVFSCVFLTSGAWRHSEEMQQKEKSRSRVRASLWEISCAAGLLESMSRIMSWWHLPQSEFMAGKPTATSSISFSPLNRPAGTTWSAPPSAALLSTNSRAHVSIQNGWSPLHPPGFSWNSCGPTLTIALSAFSSGQNFASRT